MIQILNPSLVYTKDELYDSIQRRFDYTMEFIHSKKNLKGRVTAKMIYNHANDYKFEKLDIHFYFPKELIFHFETTFE